MATWQKALVITVVLGGCSSVVTNPAVSGSAGATGTTSAAAGTGGAGSASSGAAGHGGAGGSALVGTGGAPFDAGVPLVDAGVAPAGSAELCLARPEACPLGEDPTSGVAANHLQEVLTECGSANGCPNGCFCGEMTVAFDEQGCATALGYNSGLVSEVEACLVQHLNQERWSCGKDAVAHLLVPCTTRK